MKKYNELCKFLKSHSYIDGYVDDGAVKNTFKRLSKAYLKELAVELGLDEYKINFEPGGPAITGNPSLYGGKNGKYVAVYITAQCTRAPVHIMYREIKHMKDYIGGYNQWIDNFPECGADNIVKIIGKLFS